MPISPIFIGIERDRSPGYDSFMPWDPNISPDVRTVHLGEYLPEHAAKIGDELNSRGIAWWTKDPGAISRIWQLGIEMFVDRDRLEEALQIAADVAASPRSSEP